jgi:hypothetical protein
MFPHHSHAVVNNLNENLCISRALVCCEKHHAMHVQQSPRVSAADEEILANGLAIVSELTRCLRALLVHGPFFRDLSRNIGARAHLTSLLEWLPIVLQTRLGIVRYKCLSGSARLTLHDALSSLLLLQLQTLHDCAEAHPYGFGPFLSPALSFLIDDTRLNHSDPEFPQEFSFAAFAAKALAFIASVVARPHYSRLSSSLHCKGYDAALADEAKSFLDSLFSDAVVEGLFDVCVTRYLPLSQATYTHADSYALI